MGSEWREGDRFARVARAKQKPGLLDGGWMRGGKVIEYEQIICSRKIRVCSGFSAYLPLLNCEKYFSVFRILA